jgi:hypothetical protein
MLGPCPPCMNYRRGAARSTILASLVIRFVYKKAGPLLIATDRRGTADDKPLRIFFTDVAVKLVGSERWVDAQ